MVLSTLLAVLGTDDGSSRLRRSMVPWRCPFVSTPQKPGFGAENGLSTAFGGLMTGMLGVGIGEVVVPQLVKKCGVPVPVAAGTSVLVVFLNAVGEFTVHTNREKMVLYHV